GRVPNVQDIENDVRCRQGLCEILDLDLATRPFPLLEFLETRQRAVHDDDLPVEDLGLPRVDREVRVPRFDVVQAPVLKPESVASGLMSWSARSISASEITTGRVAGGSGGGFTSSWYIRVVRTRLPLNGLIATSCSFFHRTARARATFPVRMSAWRNSSNGFRLISSGPR